ncbi:MAG: hypothetical protein ACXWDC_01830 [Aeromicrobium sp.]
MGSILVNLQLGSTLKGTTFGSVGHMPARPGTNVLCSCTAGLHDGRINRQSIAQFWDEWSGRSSVRRSSIMEFIQLVDARTDHFDEISAASMEWEEATTGRRTSRRTITTRDHNDPRRFVILAFFDSYESAMENSNLPETQALSEKLSGLVDGPVVFHDLDVIEDNI